MLVAFDDALHELACDSPASLAVVDAEMGQRDVARPHPLPEERVAPDVVVFDVREHPAFSRGVADRLVWQEAQSLAVRVA